MKVPGFLKSITPSTDSEYLGAYADLKVEYQQILSNRRKRLRTINQPLVLITQLQRSGGTLLNQLFDEHSQCFVHPPELTIGFPRKWNWPCLDKTQSGVDCFEKLFELPNKGYFKHGYWKSPNGLKENLDVFDFNLPPRFMRELFITLYEDLRPKCQRDILNLYFTAYFNAWLDYHGGFLNKKFIVSFTPRVMMYQDSKERFWADYVDGKIITIVRDPMSWFDSAKKHDVKEYGNVKNAMRLWEISARASLESVKSDPSCVIGVLFDDLLTNVEGVMREISSRLNLDFEDSMLTPTFQGQAIKANSSYLNENYGVLKDPLERQSNLSDSEKSYIHENMMLIYRNVVKEFSLNKSQLCQGRV